MAIDDSKELVVAGLGKRGQKVSKVEKDQFELLLEYGRFLRGESEATDLPTVLRGIRATICSLKVLDALRTGKIQEFGYPFT